MVHKTYLECKMLLNSKETHTHTHKKNYFSRKFVGVVQTLTKCFAKSRKPIRHVSIIKLSLLNLLKAFELLNNVAQTPATRESSAISF